MLRCFRGLGRALLYWAVLSPRTSAKLYNPEIFDDDETGDPILDPPSFNDVDTIQEFVETADGTKLNAWFFLHPERSKVLLFNIGRAGDIQQKFRHIRLLLDAGVSVFIFEYRGFGASPGLPDVDTILEDGLAAYDHLIAKGISPDEIIIFGESLGAAVAAHTSSKRSACALIMQAPFVCGRKIVKDIVKPLRHVPDRLLPIPAGLLNNLAIVEKPHPPLLIVHGEQDPIIPVAHAYELNAHALPRKELQILPASKHSDLGMAPGDIPLFEDTVTRFIAALG